MLKNVGCQFCIVGHSERRNLFKETEEIIINKVNCCLDEKIIPILCIGESLEQKRKNLTKEILIKQIKSIPKQANKNNIIIAYEPIWAIGSGLVPTLEEINEIHGFIKNNIYQSQEFKILYGGSVKSSNCKNILSQENVDGVLVGGASIDINEFNKIIES